MEIDLGKMKRIATSLGIKMPELAEMVGITPDHMYRLVRRQRAGEELNVHRSTMARISIVYNRLIDRARREV